MTVTKFAYINPITREYLYANTRDELLAALAEFAAKTYIDYYCNGQPFTFVEVDENGFEKWFAPSGEQVMTAAEIEADVRYRESFANAVPMQVTKL